MCLICWTPEVVKKREAALRGIVKRRARFSTGTSVVGVFSESEKIEWEGPVPCDKLDELITGHGSFPSTEYTALKTVFTA
ncbi:hypothetical protein AVEN_116798-1 [Araneus ventricosus]|uniref:Uncharacterized protein n=1 Tax=Araneus ventricosus TaxID=182803 RepID=A0A4Y2S9Q8_ARAVE|nr:hypothetical protein AVEN_116798-1 [Araneus ventricosus]